MSRLLFGLVVVFCWITLAPVLAQPEHGALFERRSIDEPGALWKLEASYQDAAPFSTPGGAATDPTGNTYVASHETRAPFSADVMIRKYDTSGTLVWESVYADEAGSMEQIVGLVATDEAVYLAVNERNAEGRPVMATVRYDSDGTQTWVDRIEDAYPDDREVDVLRAIALSPAGGPIVAGRVGEADGSHTDLLLIRYDPSGARVWETIFDDTGVSDFFSAESIYDLAVGEDGSVYIGGRARKEDFAVFKFAPDGAFSWLRIHPRINEPGRWVLRAIAVSPDGLIYASGYNGVFDFATTLCYTADGTYLWEHELDRVRFLEDIAVSATGHPVLLASGAGNLGLSVARLALEGTLDWRQDWMVSPEEGSKASASELALGDDGTAYAMGFRQEGYDLLAIAALGVSSSGDLLWTDTYLGTQNQRTNGFSAVPAPDGVRIVGVALGEVDLRKTVVLSYSPNGTLRWAQEPSARPTSRDYLYEITPVADAGGGVYAVGTTGPSSRGLEILTARVTPDGRVAWSQRLGGTASGGRGGSEGTRGRVLAAVEDGVLIAGVSIPVFTSTSYAIAVAKYASDGMLRWQQRYGDALPAGTRLEPVALSSDGTGGVYVLIERDLPGGNPDYTLLRYDAAGTLLWEREEDGASDFATSPKALVLTDEGIVVVSTDEVSADATFILSVLYDVDGNEQARQRLGSPNERNSALTALAAEDGGVYIVGSGRLDGDLADGLLVIKYGTGGQLEWSRTLGDRAAATAALAPDGLIVVNQGFRSIVTRLNGGGETEWSYTLQSSRSTVDVVATDDGRTLVTYQIVREERPIVFVDLIADGALQHEYQFPSVDPFLTLVPPSSLLAFDSNGAAYLGVTRYPYGYSGYIPSPGPSVDPFPTPYSAIVGRRLDLPPPASQGSIVEAEVSGTEGQTILSIPSPNPFQSQTKLRLSAADAQTVTVEVFDMLGRRVALLFEGEVAPDEQRALTLDGDSLPSGVYIVRATGETFAQSHRITLVR